MKLRRRKTLAIIPTYMREPMDLEVFADCVRSLRATAGDKCDVLVVDDASPNQDLVEAAESMKSKLDFELHRQEENHGFATTVNIGLRQALREKRNAVLVNADIEFSTPDWLDVMEGQQRSDGEGLASMVGALLLYPNGLIQHAGVYFSLLYRNFDHIYRHGPGDLPEAQVPRVCPVTAALHFIRHECLAEVGVYDEEFRLGHEDVDYCLRAWQSGREVVYQPRIRAYHFESMFRGRSNDKIAKWQAESWIHFCRKHASTSFDQFVPSVV